MDQYDKDTYAKCIVTDIQPVSVMNRVSTQNAQAILSRMGIEYTEGLHKEAYLIAIYDEFVSDRRWILQMFPMDFLTFLLEIWESKYIEMDALRWTLLEYLRCFGLLDYKKTVNYSNRNSNNKNSNNKNGDNKNGDNNCDGQAEIYIIESMRQNFYFYLKSSDSRELMKRYERWDNIICGLSYYYGIIHLHKFYVLFSEIVSEQVSYEEFTVFVKCRADIWELGSIMKNGLNHEYFVNRNVDHPDYVLLYMREHSSLNYKKISYGDLAYIKEGYGIDNRWPGVSELGNMMVNEMNISYYRSTVLIQTILKLIQNSAEFDRIRDNLDLIEFSDDKQKQCAKEFIRQMYYHIPIYEYKGYTRDEFSSINKQNEWKNKKKRFRIITGGKN